MFNFWSERLPLLTGGHAAEERGSQTGLGKSEEVAIKPECLL